MSNYTRSQPIYVWMKPDPEETLETVWAIAESACTSKDDVNWLTNAYGLENELRDAVADEPGGIPEDCTEIFVVCHLWSEKMDSVDYGTDYDGGVEVDELICLYNETPLEYEESDWFAREWENTIEVFGRRVHMKVESYGNEWRWKAILYDGYFGIASITSGYAVTSSEAMDAAKVNAELLIYTT